MKSRNHVVLTIAAVLFLLIVVMEWMFPLNVVGAFGFVLPILLVATLRSRRLMLITLTLCIVVTFVGALSPGQEARTLHRSGLQPHHGGHRPDRSGIYGHHMGRTQGSRGGRSEQLWRRRRNICSARIRSSWKSRINWRGPNGWQP